MQGRTNTEFVSTDLQLEKLKKIVLKIHMFMFLKIVHIHDSDINYHITIFHPINIYKIHNGIDVIGNCKESANDLFLSQIRQL